MSACYVTGRPLPLHSWCAYKFQKDFVLSVCCCCCCCLILFSSPCSYSCRPTGICIGRCVPILGIFLWNFMKTHWTVFQLLYNTLSARIVKREALDTHRQLNGFQRKHAHSHSHSHTWETKLTRPTNIYIYISWPDSPCGLRTPLWGSSISLRHTSLCRAPLDDW